MPAPEAAALRYCQAVEQGDAHALWSMLTERARNELSEKELAQLLEENSPELKGFSQALAKEKPPAEGKAEFYKEGRKTAELSLSQGTFWVEVREVLPPQPSTPEGAARALRAAVLARDYQRVLGLLTPTGRKKVESAFDSLDESLADLEKAVVDVRQDQAVIELLGGRRILLKKEDSVWLVEEIE